MSEESFEIDPKDFTVRPLDELDNPSKYYKNILQRLNGKIEEITRNEYFSKIVYLEKKKREEIKQKLKKYDNEQIQTFIEKFRKVLKQVFVDNKIRSKIKRAFLEGFNTMLDITKDKLNQRLLVVEWFHTAIFNILPEDQQKTFQNMLPYNPFDEFSMEDENLFDDIPFDDEF